MGSRYRDDHPDAPGPFSGRDGAAASVIMEVVTLPSPGASMLRRRRVAPALVLASLVPLTVAAVPLGAAAGVPRCDGVAATVVGTAGHDTLRGTAGRDVVVGLGGDDTIDALGGDDVVCGGPGSDRLVGGPGEDRLYGGGDRLSDGPGGTFLVGDTLLGGPGDDLLDGGDDSRRADDRRRPDTYSWAGAGSAVTVDLSGRLGRATGEGSDRIVLGPAHGLTGSAYADTITGSAARDTVDGGAGGDTIATGGGADTVFPDGQAGLEGRDTVSTGPGADLVSSLAGRDRIAAGGGSDFVEAFSDSPTEVDTGPGDDYLGQLVAPGRGAVAAGGPGDDVVAFYGRLLANQSPAARFTVDLREGRTSVSGEVTASGTVRGFEGHRLVGALRWRFLGGAASDRVWGIEGGPLRAVMGGGNDSVTGTPRDDLIDGGAGTDSGYRGGGRDTCRSVERGDC